MNVPSFFERTYKTWFQCNPFWIPHSYFNVIHRYGTGWEANIHLIFTLVPPSVSDCDREDCGGSPQREVPVSSGFPSDRREDASLFGGWGIERRPAGDPVLEPAGDFFDLEPLPNRWEITIFPAALGGDSTPFLGLNVPDMHVCTCTSLSINLDWWSTF